jgi:hypothetical protein
MRRLLVLGLIMAGLSACAGDPCGAPTERELRQGVVRGVSASCNPAPPVAATKESKP